MKNYAAGKSVFVKASADTFVGLISPQRAALVYVAKEARKIALIVTEIEKLNSALKPTSATVPTAAAK